MTVNIFETEKIAVKFSLNYSKLKNRNVVAVNINLNVSSLTQILIVTFPTSN